MIYLLIIIVINLLRPRGEFLVFVHHGLQIGNVRKHPSFAFPHSEKYEKEFIYDFVFAHLGRIFFIDHMRVLTYNLDLIIELPLIMSKNTGKSIFSFDWISQIISYDKS